MENYQREFFSNKSINNIDINSNITKISINSHIGKQQVVSSQPEIKSEPQSVNLNFASATNKDYGSVISVELNGGYIHDPKIVGIKLKHNINISVLPTICRLIYEALKESELEANSGYNGWNFLWSYKTENEKRHKTYREDYQALLQYAASAYPYIVVDNPSPDRYISAEQMLCWVDRVTENEKKYWSPYRLYARLNDIAEGLRTFIGFRNLEAKNLEKKAFKANNSIGKNSTETIYPFNYTLDSKYIKRQTGRAIDNEVKHTAEFSLRK